MKVSIFAYFKPKKKSQNKEEGRIYNQKETK